MIGAGANARAVHIPGFRGIQACEIAAVANRSLESSQRVADEFNIPRAYANWRELLDDDRIDAVCIGTWPYMHRTLTLSALERGKTCADPGPDGEYRARSQRTCWRRRCAILTWCANWSRRPRPTGSTTC